MNLSRVSVCVARCCIRKRREGAGEYYGSDERDCFHGHYASGAFQKAIRNTSNEPGEGTHRLLSLDHLDLHDWVNFPRRRAPRMMKSVTAELLDR